MMRDSLELKTRQQVHFGGTQVVNGLFGVQQVQDIQE